MNIITIAVRQQDTPQTTIDNWGKPLQSDKCDRCQQPVWIDSASLQRIKERHGQTPTPICHQCTTPAEMLTGIVNSTPPCG